MKIIRHPANTLLAPFWAIWSNHIVPETFKNVINKKYFVTKNTGLLGNGFEVVLQTDSLNAAETKWIQICNHSSADPYLGGSSRSNVSAFDPFTQVLNNSIIENR